MSPFPKVKHKLRNGKSRAAKNLQHMPRNDRQGKRNPRVSLKAKAYKCNPGPKSTQSRQGPNYFLAISKLKFWLNCSQNFSRVNPSIFNPPNLHSQEFASAAKILELLRLHLSTRSLLNIPLGVNFRSRMIFLKHALILTSQTVKADHGQPDSHASA